nr:MAG TPA: hypothetical protein [Caudoviricetes sp.]
MPPFSEVSGHDHLGFKTVRKDRSSFLRGTTLVQQIEVGDLSVFARPLPDVVGRVGLGEGRGTNDGNFAAEALLTVVAVPSGLLTERRQTVTDDLMAHAPVADEADSERAMLNDSFVTPLDNAPDELLCTPVRDFIFGLVASAPCGFDGGQKGLIFGSVDKLHRRFNDFHALHPRNMACQHIGLMCPQHIRVIANSTGVIIPLRLVGESAHVVADTHDFFIGQRIELREKHDGLIAVTFQKGVGVVLPCLFVIDWCASTIKFFNVACYRMAVLVDLTQVMEHTHDEGRTSLAPDQMIGLSERQKVLRDHAGVVQKTALVIAVVLGRSGGGEEAVSHQVLHHVIGNNRGSVRQLHEVQKIGHFGLGEAVRHFRTPFCEYSFRCRTRQGNAL